jgi:thiamine pyrophosphate-dependent acetolactate synthase large subunit-like protein
MIKPGTINDLGAAVCVLAESRRAAILAGPGARCAMDPLETIASHLGAAVLTTPDAVSIYGTKGLRSDGVWSFGAAERARVIAGACDAALVVGTNLGEFAGKSGEAFHRATIIHVTDDPADLCIARPAAVSLVGDVSAILGRLADALPCERQRRRWVESLAVESTPSTPAATAGNGIGPKEAMAAIGQATPPRARIACDITTAALVLLHDMPLHAETSVWLQIERSACLGTALAAGLGVRLASRMPTLALLGDWGLMAGAAELHTVATLRPSNFVIVAWSNEGGAMIRNGVQYQKLAVPDELHTWISPSFAEVARGFGIRAVKVCTAADLGEAVREGMRAPSPLLVHAVIDPSGEIPGASDRYRALKDSGKAE